MNSRRAPQPRPPYVGTMRARGKGKSGAISGDRVLRDEPSARPVQPPRQPLDPVGGLLDAVGEARLDHLAALIAREGEGCRSR